jgi:hypothetical protein
MLEIISSKETSEIAVVTESKQNEWGWYEQCKTWSHQEFQNKKW